MEDARTGMLPMGLLEYLTFKSGLIYLSDLRTPWAFVTVVREVAAISSKYFSVSEWNEAIRYLLNEDAQFTDADQAKEYLLAGLGRDTRDKDW